MMTGLGASAYCTLVLLAGFFLHKVSMWRAGYRKGYSYYLQSNTHSAPGGMTVAVMSHAVHMQLFVTASQDLQFTLLALQ